MITYYAASKILSELTVYMMALTAGFTGQSAATATCVAKYESGFNAAATNKNRDGSKDHGLMQINDFWNRKKICSKSGS